MKLKYIIIAFLFAPISELFAQLHIEGIFFIDENAEVHVWNDLEIATTAGELSNEGWLEVEGNFQKFPEASFNANPNNLGRRAVFFRNDDFNTDGNQRISGDMTGDNAFYNLMIDNRATDGLVDMDVKIEVKNQLSFMAGRLRTDVMSQNDGAAYPGEVFVSNPSPTAISGQATIGGESRFVEGKLRRAISGMGENIDFPVGLAQGAEPFLITFTTPADPTTILATHQTNTTTDLGLIQQCDVGTGGANSDPFTPDGNLDNLTIDCVTGQWTVEAADNIGAAYDIIFFPSDPLLNQCTDALYFFVGKDGVLEDCPDIDPTDGIARTGLTGFSSFDIATASEMSSVFTSVEVIPSNDKRVVLFPNPVEKGIVNLKLEGDVFSTGEGHLEIYNASGKIVLRQAINLFENDQMIQIPFENSNPGLYQLVVRNDNQLATKTFMLID